jgi:hypothetical protein
MRAPVQIEVRSQHVPGTYFGWTADGVSFMFTSAVLTRIVLAANGSWRLQRGDRVWQEHGPNTDGWVDLEQVNLGIAKAHRLDRGWGWQAVGVFALPAEELVAVEPAAPTRLPVPRKASRPAAVVLHSTDRVS